MRLTESLRGEWSAHSFRMLKLVRTLRDIDRSRRKTPPMASIPLFLWLLLTIQGCGGFNWTPFKGCGPGAPGDIVCPTGGGGRAPGYVGIDEPVRVAADAHYLPKVNPAWQDSASASAPSLAATQWRTALTQDDTLTFMPDGRASLATFGSWPRLLEQPTETRLRGIWRQHQDRIFVAFEFEKVVLEYYGRRIGNKLLFNKFHVQHYSGYANPRTMPLGEQEAHLTANWVDRSVVVDQSYVPQRHAAWLTRAGTGPDFAGSAWVGIRPRFAGVPGDAYSELALLPNGTVQCSNCLNGIWRQQGDRVFVAAAVRTGVVEEWYGSFDGKTLLFSVSPVAYRARSDGSAMRPDVALADIFRFARR